MSSPSGAKIQARDKSNSEPDKPESGASGTIGLEVKEADNANVLAKIDRRLVPVLFVIYFLQSIDKQTLSFSSVFGLVRQTQLIGNEYSLLGSVGSIVQLALQPLSAYFLIKFRLSIYIPLLVACWGATLACMSAAHNFTGLFVARLFLGMFEASVFGSFVLLTQTWYRRREQGFRLAIWSSAVGWVNIFGSLIMFGIGHIHSKVLRPYQTISLLLGTITFFVGLGCFFVYPDSLERCSFLSQDEKAIAAERVRANQQGFDVAGFKPRQVIEMLLDIKSWCWMILMFFHSIPNAGVASFGPFILRGFGFNKFNTMLVMIPFGALQVIIIFSAFWASRRIQMKTPLILLSSILCMTGTALLRFTGREPKDQPALLGGYYLLSTSVAIGPLVTSWQASNVAGLTKKTTTNAFMTMGSLSGSIVGPLLFRPTDQPYYHRGLTAMVASYLVCICLVCFTALYLRHLNIRNQSLRVAAGKCPNPIDYSMLSDQDMAKISSQTSAQLSPTFKEIHLVDSGHGGDLTDLQNNNFIYLY